MAETDDSHADREIQRGISSEIKKKRRERPKVVMLMPP